MRIWGIFQMGFMRVGGLLTDVVTIGTILVAALGAAVIVGVLVLVIPWVGIAVLACVAVGVVEGIRQVRRARRARSEDTDPNG
jgi:hypothetical protein